ncbi:MAG: GNAT family N-acetyltransferase [Pseudomonadota bacterium]
MPELMSLLPLHYEELALNKEEVKLSPQFDLYEQYEREGRLLVVTLRELGEIVGYYVGLVAPGLHYSTCLTCITDIFYIRKDKRNGSAGVRLFRYIEKELRRRGVQRWFMGSKVHADASALFKRIGAEPVETYYSKWMGD